MSLKYSTTIIADRLTQLNTDIGVSAQIKIYSGARPANVNTAASGTLLATLTGSATAFGTVAAGVLTANAIASAAAVAAGTAAWFRVFKSDGTTACVDGDIASTGSDLNLNNTSIAIGQNVGITSFAITGQPV